MIVLTTHQILIVYEGGLNLEVKSILDMANKKIEKGLYHLIKFLLKKLKSLSFLKYK